MWCSEDGWRVPDQSSDYANTTDQWAGACIYHKVSLFTLLDGDNITLCDGQEDNMLYIQAQMTMGIFILGFVPIGYFIMEAFFQTQVKSKLRQVFKFCF